MTDSQARPILLFGAVLLLLLTLCSCGKVESEELICDFNELVVAVKNAEDGDVLLVGDIDFRPISPSVAYNYMCVEIDRSITIKSGKPDAPASFINGGLKIKGSKVAGENTLCVFENIVFDGCADTAALGTEDFEYPWSETEQVTTWFAPLKAQQAIAVEGNARLEFSGCEFRNYMHEYGPIIDLRYADYTDNPYINDRADYSGCSVEIELDDCKIENNAAFYDGGAIYVEANNNVTITARNTVISNNRSGGGDFRRGGGAIYAEHANLVLIGCTLDNNLANHMYSGLALPELDTHCGGALCLSNGSARLTDCAFSGNRASMGGAISLTNMKAELDGCRFTENRAQAFATNPYGTTGPWSNMAQGGALYVEGTNGATVSMINCELSENSAATAYGGLYAFGPVFDNGDSIGFKLNISLCSFENNTVDTEYEYPVEESFAWFSHPGDIFSHKYITLSGCYIVDAAYASDFVRNEAPSSDNGFNYISSVSDASARELKLPSDISAQLLSGRYEDKLKSVHIGSNYAKSLYTEKSELSPSIFLLPITAVCVPAAAMLLWVLRRRRLTAVRQDTMIAEIPESDIPAPEPSAPKPQLIMTRYTDEEIERIIAEIPETQRLTGRELEVLREVLQGKKQGEVAYDLGIEVSTVKDFYRKIYDKLGVQNKQALLQAATEVLKKQS